MKLVDQPLSERGVAQACFPRALSPVSNACPIQGSPLLQGTHSCLEEEAGCAAVVADGMYYQAQEPGILKDTF